MSYQDIFQRYEIKYLMTKAQKKHLLEQMADQILPDAFMKSTINNIYFDTPDKYLIRKSLEKPVYKEKLRVRSYGTATPDSNVFLELKKKYKDIVYKRRICVAEKEAMAYLLQKKPLPQSSQISREIDYFCQFYSRLMPSVVLSYEREAYYWKEDSNLRITFDESILWREEDFSLCQKPGGRALLLPGQVLMELKIAGAMPLWLTKLLTENQLYKTSFSKYGCAYQQMLEDWGGKKYA